MSRYFYPCSIRAAYMAKEFGMLFKSAGRVNLYFDGGSDFRHEKDSGVYGGEKFYIHPDSEKLLEGMPGDMMFCLGNDGDPDIGLICEDMADVGFSDYIIQRDGKPFFWPEVEGAQ